MTLLGEMNVTSGTIKLNRNAQMCYVPQGKSNEKIRQIDRKFKKEDFNLSEFIQFDVKHSQWTGMNLELSIVIDPVRIIHFTY